jgi:hypothetical protein
LREAVRPSTHISELAPPAPNPVSGWWAMAAAQRDTGAQACYRRRRDAGDGHEATLRRLAGKLIGQLRYCQVHRCHFHRCHSDPSRAWLSSGDTEHTERRLTTATGWHGAVASADHRERAGWADASSSCPSVRAEVWLRRFPVPTGRDHAGCALVPCAVPKLDTGCDRVVRWLG